MKIQRTTNNSLSRRAGKQRTTRSTGILPVSVPGRAGTPALPARAATPYSSAFCLLPSVFSRKSRRAGFSLAEILIAIFVLSIGLIMIAGVFPVAAKWTAEDAQTSVAQVIAKNAVEQIQTQQGMVPAGGGFVGPYCYDFGASSPYPNANSAPLPVAFTTPPQGSYYWSAYVLPATYAAGSSGVFPGTSSRSYTIFVFVFNKGDASNLFLTPLATGKFGTSTLAPMTPYPQNATYADSAYPQLYSDTLGDVVTATPSGLPMPIGSLGVDATTGQVFREIVDPNTNALTITGIPESSAVPNPYFNTAAPGHGDDTIIYAPAAINQTASPLIYVYVTTVNL